jgi:small ligand-binding sensory domain FIST
MPGSVVVGGAVKPGGALFAGDGALNENAAVSGIFIRGKFRMTAHSLHSCRPVGNAMTLTRAVDGHVLDLDGRSAGDVLSRMLQELPDHVSGLPVMLGVGEAPKGVGGGGGGGDSDEGGSVKREGPRPSRDVKGRVVDSDGSASGDVSGSVSGDVSGDVSGLDNTKSSSATARAKAASKIVADAQGGEYKRAELDAVKNAVDGYASGGAGFVYRDIVMADRETGGIFIGRHSLENGAPVRLHVRDNEWGRARSKELMRLVDDERKNRGGDSGARKKKKDTGDGVELNPNPKPLRGAVMYTCVSGNRLHAANFRERVPGVELGGGYTSGELGPSAKGRQSHMHSHTSVLGLFWDS